MSEDLEREDQDVEEEHLGKEVQQDLPNSSDLNLSQKDILNFLRIQRVLARPRDV